MRLSGLVLIGFLCGISASFVSACVDLGPPCSADNCATGCCSGGLCVPGTATNACGRGGGACNVCQGTFTCHSQLCSNGAGGGTATGGGMTGGGDATGGGGVTTTTLTGHAVYDFVPIAFTASTGVALLDFAHTTQKPVRGAVVQVMLGTMVLASSTTGDDGSYSITYEPQNASLRVAVLAQTMTPPIRVVDNTAGNVGWSITANIPTGATSVDLHATSGWTGTQYGTTRTAGPFAILDTLLTTERAFVAARSTNFPSLTVYWSPNNVPQSGMAALGKIGSTHFSPSETALYVLGKDGVDTDEYDAHVLVHEWAHFYEANFSRSDSPGARQWPGASVDPRLAFSEGWANALGAMVLGDTVYADTSWTTMMPVVPTGRGFDVETAPTPTDDAMPNAFSVSSETRLLYDLFDPANESFDTVSLGLGPLIDTFTGAHKRTEAVTTLSSFLNGLKQQTGVDSAAIDTLASHWHVGSITSDFGDGDSPLKAMFTQATVPFTATVGFTSGQPSNSWQQNQYFVFVGNGSQVTCSVTAAQDVAIVGYHQGIPVGSSNQNTSGTEQFSFASTAGVTYVLVVTGFGAQSGNYSVQVNIN